VFFFRLFMGIFVFIRRKENDRCHKREEVKIFSWNFVGGKREVHLYPEYQTVCDLVGIGTPHPPFRKRGCPPPPEPKGGGEAGVVPIPTTGEKLSTLPTL